MKKILFLITQSEMGGAQRYLIELISGLENYDILVAAGQGNGELFKKLENNSVKTFNLKKLKRAPNPFNIIPSLLEILNLLKKEQPNILFLCSTTAGLLGSISSFFYKPHLKVIYRIGGWAFKDPRPYLTNKLIFWLEQTTAPLKDILIVNSEEDRKIAIEKNIYPKEKIIKIYNGIDIGKLEFLEKEKAKEFLSQHINQKLNKEYLVGTVANFYKTKGLRYLIEAAHSLKSKTEIKFIIIGEGKERHNLESLIKKYNLEKQIILAGKIADAYKYLEAFNLIVLPSLKEGFPWIALETMASDTPIIATKVGAVPEIIEDKVNGLLVEPSDSRELAEKIAWALENKEKLNDLSYKAKKALENFDSKTMIKETKKLF